MHLVIAGTIDDIGRNLGKRRGGGIEATTTDDAPLLVATDAVATIEGSNDAGKFDRGIDTILVIVHAGTLAGSPLVRAMQIDVNLLATTEGIATGDTGTELRTHASDGAGIEIGLDVEVPRLVESAVQRQVEGIASSGSIARCKFKLGHGEQAHCIDLADRLEIVVIAIELTRAQLHIGHEHTGTDGWFIAREADGEIATAERIGRLFHKGFAHVDVDTSDIPLVLGSLGHIVGQLEAQLCLSVHLEGIGKIGGIVRLEIAIAIVAQQGIDTIALSIEIGKIEGVAPMNQGFGKGAMNQTVSMSRKSEIAHAVEHIESSRVNGVFNLRGLGILLGDGLITDLSVEIAVVAQYTTSHHGAQLWIDPRHQHRLFAERLGHPFGKTTILISILVPDADTKREGQAVVAASEQRTVGGCGQSGFHLLLGVCKVIVLLIVLIGYLLQSRKEFVALGNVLRHGTGSERKQEGKKAKGQKDCCLHLPESSLIFYCILHFFAVFTFLLLSCQSSRCHVAW